MNSEKRTFDPAQQVAIDVDENAVVSAGAGSGKTTVLVERYARLVEKRGLSVDSILALTFTRKAAAEMNSRIHARLAASHESAAKEQLDRFDSARISTLDSFCGTVARGAAHRYGIPPDFVVDEARLERVADEISVELLMNRKEEPTLRRLVATMGFDRVRRSLFSRIAVEHVGVAKRPAFADDALRQVR
ncbi:MAG: UvrD-helicase domain-containing protein, partial [Treponemataceae bacterium]